MPAGSLMHDCMIFSTHNDKVSITETWLLVPRLNSSPNSTQRPNRYCQTTGPSSAEEQHNSANCFNYFSISPSNCRIGPNFPLSAVSFFLAGARYYFSDKNKLSSQ
jgi:hypothetical protein